MSLEYLPVSGRQRQMNWAKKQRKEELKHIAEARKEDLLHALKKDQVGEGLIKKGVELREHPNWPKARNLSLSEFGKALCLTPAVLRATHLKMLGLTLQDTATLCKCGVSAVKFNLSRANTILRLRLDLSPEKTLFRGTVLAYLYLYYLSDQLNNKLDEHGKKNFIWDGLNESDGTA